MKIYDSHSDIFHNLYTRTVDGDKDPFLHYHLDDLQKGHIEGGIWVVYSDKDFDIMDAYQTALAAYEPYKDKFDVILGLEGLRNVPNLDMFDRLYKMGVRHAMLTWNEANHLATGVKGNPEYGLTPLGKKFVQYMNEHNMIVDVSHLNEKSFYDVLEQKPKILIASHSNAYALSNHPRNLKDEQLVALRDAGGMIGVVAARNFVSRDKEKQNIKGFVDQIEYLVNIMGIDKVMLGLDMMNFLDDFDNSNLDDLQSHADTLKIVDELRVRNFDEVDIEKICFKNYLSLKERVMEE
ncbi:MAG: membrane dipeptidase [Bacilli bacterium]|nr:membrane dipeptidase [Bacilli bacterium]